MLGGWVPAVRARPLMTAPRRVEREKRRPNDRAGRARDVHCEPVAATHSSCRRLLP
jgi:hypothetical protein